MSVQSFARIGGGRRFADSGAVIVEMSELHAVPVATRAPGGTGLVVYGQSTPMGEKCNFHVAAIDLAAEPAARSRPITASQRPKTLGWVSHELVDPAWMVWMDQDSDDGDVHAVQVPAL